MRQLLYTKRWLIKVFTLLALIACSSEQAHSQAITNMGKEFWVGYGHHEYMEKNCDGTGSEPNTMNMVIYLSNTSNAIANVRVVIDSSGSNPTNPATWWGNKPTDIIQILPNTVVETKWMPKGPIVQLFNGVPTTDPNYDSRLVTDPPPAGSGGEGVFRGKGIHIISDIPIVAYAHIFGQVSSGATMLLPIEAWGYSYTSVNSEQKGYSKVYNWMYVIAKEDSTWVEITPSEPSRMGKQPWVPFEVLLMKGQIYQLIGSANCENGEGVQLTGTRIKSISKNGSGCKAIAVFSGSGRTGGEETICGGNSSKDNDIQQCYPHHAWGNRYVTAPFSRSTGTLPAYMTNIFKVAVKDPSTVVKRNGVPLGKIEPSITIWSRQTEITDTICVGESVTFYAKPVNGGANAEFEWRKNTVLMSAPGNTSDTITVQNLQNGDQITCTLITKLNCATVTTPATSNTVTVRAKNRTVPSIKVYSTSESNCGSSPIVFDAATANGGSTPIYQWYFNGVAVSGTQTSTHTVNAYTPGDSVYATLGSNAGCLTTTNAVKSNVVYLTNNPAPLLSAETFVDKDVTQIICPGTTITFTAATKNAGNSPIYQWKKIKFGGTVAENIGTNTSTFVATATDKTNPGPNELVFGDSIFCEVTGSASCVTPNLVNSNKVGLVIGAAKTAGVVIYATSNNTCGTDPIVIKAQPYNLGGTAPSYDWYYEDFSVYPPAPPVLKQSGPGDTYSLSNAHLNDRVSCVMTTDDACVGNKMQPAQAFKVTEANGLINRSYYIYTSNTPDYIEADKPVQVAQFMSNAGPCAMGNGDPEMVFLSPIEQAIKKTIFYKTNREQLSSNAVTLLIPTGGLPSLNINNSKTYSAFNHPNKPGYSIVVQQWPANATTNGQVIVTSDTGFNATTYGLGGAESYAYNAGTMFINTNGLPAIHNEPDTSAPYTIHPYTFVAAPTKLRALIAYQPLSMNWHVSSIGCSVIDPCADVLVQSPVPIQTVMVGNKTYYLYELPGVYTFKVPGTVYLPIDLTSPNFDNTTCSNYENVMVEIIVKPKPTVDYQYYQNAGCGVDTVKFYGPTQSIELYNVIKYNWHFTANDSSSQQNPSFYFPVKGTYPVKLSIVTQYGGIADTTINVVVTEGNRPHSNFGVYPATICLGEQPTFIDSTNRIETEAWYWDFGNGDKDTVYSNVDFQYPSYTAPGTYIVKHTMIGSTFSCLPDTVTRTVIVATTPKIDSVKAINTTGCPGNDGKIEVYGLNPNTPHDISYVLGGTTYTVTVTSNATGMATVTNLSIGTYSDIKATIGNCSSSTAGPVTINQGAAPAQPTAGSNSPVCVNGSIDLTATTATTGTIVYNWTGPNAYTSTTQNPSISFATTSMSGTYSVTATLNGCTSTPGTVNVVVNALPVIGSSSVSNTQTCNTATGSILLNGLQANTAYTVKYTYNSTVTTVTITSDAVGTIVIGGLASGTYSNVNVSLGACQSSSVGPFTITDPNPPASPTVGPAITICEGATINLTANSGLSNITYEWTGPNSYTSTQQNPTITNAPLTANGTYNVVVVNQSNCKSQPSSIVVTVKPLPNVPTAASNTPICAGTTLNLTSSSTAGSTYSWTGPNSFSSSVQNPNITNATTAASGTYTVTASLNGCIASKTTDAVVNAVPAIGTTSSTNPTSCTSSTGTITLNGLLANTTYTVNYTSASGAQTASIASTTGGSVIITNLPAGTYSNITVGLNNCTSSVVGPFTLTDPAAPARPNVTTNAPICSGTGLNLFATSATAGVTYSWTGPDAFTSTQQNPVIAAAPVTASGTYSVTATLNNCVSLPGTNAQPVEVKQTPIVSSSTSTNPTNCASATGTIVLNGLTPNTLYTVSYTKNGGPQTIGITTNASGVLTITNLTAATYNNLIATYNGCSSSPVGPFTLSDPTPPATPVAGADQTLCAASTLTLTASSSTAGVTYNWTGPNSFSSTQQNPSIANITTAGTGNYIVTATLNNCVSSAATTNVIVYATPAISNASKLDPTSCGSSTGSITLNGLLANTSYLVSYTKNGGTVQTATITSNGSNSLTIPSLSAGTYADITVKLATCTSAPVGPFTLSDPAPPAALVASNNGPLCENSTLNLSAGTTTSGAVTYAWTGPNSFTSAVQNPSIASVATLATGVYTVTATLNNCSSTTTTTVVVSPYPVVNFTTPTFVCMPNNYANFTNQTTVPGGGAMTYLWSFGDGATTSDVNGSHIYAAISTYPVTLTATANGCSRSTSKQFSAFYDKPVADFKADKDTICQGVTTKFSDLSTAPNSTITNWSWDFGDGSLPSTQANPTKLYSVPNQYGIRLTVKNAQGCTSDVKEKSIRVYVQPKIDAGQSFIVPIGTTVRFNPTANDSTTVTFAWTPAADFVNPNILRPDLVVTRNQTYKLTATGLGNCQASDTLSVVALQALTIPNAFSPNGDGINDKWDIKNFGDYSFALLEVFNRNGQLVYKSYGYNQPWDGTMNGKPLPVGIYYYIIDFKTMFPRKSGYVTILR